MNYDYSKVITSIFELFENPKFSKHIDTVWDSGL